MKDEMILPLHAPLDIQVYGGKAARLAACLRAGLPVPPGFALHSDLVVRIARGALSAGERATLERHLEQFGDAAVAVRSSAIGEDGTTASFAGQHTSFLNVRGLDGVLAAIKNVWASGQTASAQRYRVRMGIGGDPQVAVVVQALIPAEVAGVLFTLDPLSGSQEHWIVEASWGLGEAVVAGLVTPDHYVISRAGEIVERQLGQKDVAVIPQDHGGTNEVEINDPARVQGSCLSEQALASIAGLGIACERLFGAGQDIEWALAGGNIYLLQARPVTTAP